MNKRIGILGAGNIGGTIGKKWAQAGHVITFGVRDVNADKVKSLLAAVGHQGTAATIGKAIQDNDVLLFALPGNIMAETIARHSGELGGKIIIDASNQVGQPVMNSLADFREQAPSARLFRAFNNLGWENFEQPRFGDEQADLFYCGDEGEAQATVDQLIADVGLRPVYVGGLDQVSIIDALTGLWFALALRQGRGRHLAFRMIHD